MNRAPGPADRWWNDHKSNCSGQFIKIREPEKPEKKISKDKESSKVPKNQNTLDRYITSPMNKNPKTDLVGPSNSFSKGLFGQKDAIKSPGSFTKLGNDTNNVYGFGTGGPGSLSSVAGGRSNVQAGKSPAAIHFTGAVGGRGTGKSRLLDCFTSTPKKSKKLNVSAKEIATCPICEENYPEETINAHLDDCLMMVNKKNGNPPAKRPKLSTLDNKNTEVNVNQHNCPICNIKFPAEELNNHLDTCLLTENKSINTATAVTPTFHECCLCHNYFDDAAINDHVELCLLQQNNKRDSIVNLLDSPKTIASTVDLTESSTSPIIKTNIIRCPSCRQNVMMADYVIHVEDCLAEEKKKLEVHTHPIVVFNDDFSKPGSSKQNLNENYKCLVCNTIIDKSIPLDEHLELCVVMTYGESDDSQDPIDEFSINSTEEEKHLCPICMKMIGTSLMAAHVDDCIKNNN